MPLYTAKTLKTIRDIYFNEKLIEEKIDGILKTLKENSKGYYHLPEELLLDKFVAIFTLLSTNIVQNKLSSSEYKTLYHYKGMAQNLITLLYAYVENAYVENNQFTDQDKFSVAKVIYEVAYTIMLLQEPFNKLTAREIDTLNYENNLPTDRLFDLNDKGNEGKLFKILFEIIRSYSFENLLDIQRLIIALTKLMSCQLYDPKLGWHQLVEGFIVQQANRLISTAVANPEINTIIFTCTLSNYLLNTVRGIHSSNNEVTKTLWNWLKKTIDHITIIINQYKNEEKKEEKEEKEEKKNEINEEKNKFIKRSFPHMVKTIYHLSLTFFYSRSHLIALVPQEQNILTELFTWCLNSDYYTQAEKLKDLIRLASCIALLDQKLTLLPCEIHEKVIDFAQYLNSKVAYDIKDFTKLDKEALNRLGFVYVWLKHDIKSDNIKSDDNAIDNAASDNNTVGLIYSRIKSARKLAEKQISVDGRVNHYLNLYLRLWKKWKEQSETYLNLKVDCIKFMGLHQTSILITHLETKVACFFSTQERFEKDCRRNQYLFSHQKELDISHVHMLYLDPSKEQIALEKKMSGAIDYILEKYCPTLKSTTHTVSVFRRQISTLTEKSSSKNLANFNFPGAAELDAIDQVSSTTDVILDFFEKLAELSQVDALFQHLNPSTKKKLNSLLSPLIQLINFECFPLENTLQLFHSLSQLASYQRIKSLFDTFQLLTRYAHRQHMNYQQNAKILSLISVCAEAGQYPVAELSPETNQHLLNIMRCVITRQSYLQIPFADSMNAFKSFSLLAINITQLNSELLALFIQFMIDHEQLTLINLKFIVSFLNGYSENGRDALSAIAKNITNSLRKLAMLLYENPSYNVNKKSQQSMNDLISLLIPLIKSIEPLINEEILELEYTFSLLHSLGRFAAHALIADPDLIDKMDELYFMIPSLMHRICKAPTKLNYVAITQLIYSFSLCVKKNKHQITQLFEKQDLAKIIHHLISLEPCHEVLSQYTMNVISSLDSLNIKLKQINFDNNTFSEWMRKTYDKSTSQEASKNNALFFFFPKTENTDESVKHPHFQN